MADRAMGDREYVIQGGLVCPFCRSHNVECATRMKGEARQCSQDIRCLDCKRTWRDIYELTGYEVLNRGGMATEVNGKPECLASLYLLLVWSDIEPDLAGPFAGDSDRDAYAREFREKYGPDHGIFLLDIPEEGQPAVEGYSGGFFEDEEELAA